MDGMCSRMMMAVYRPIRVHMVMFIIRFNTWASYDSFFILLFVPCRKDVQSYGKTLRMTNLYDETSFLFNNSVLIISSKSAICMAPICIVGCPNKGMNKNVGMLCMPNSCASSRSWSISTL